MSSDDSTTSNPYADYWQRKRLLQSGLPHFPVKRWWSTTQLCPIEQVYLNAIRGAASVLDVGAGDLRVKKKFLAHGYTGIYHTLDVGSEYSHDYQTIEDVRQHYSAVICLDVIEHLTLKDGLHLIDKMLGVLSSNGVLVLQTPNAKCVRNPLSWDMTHLHIYNLPDLWSFLSCRCGAVDGYRVWFTPERMSPLQYATGVLQRAVATHVLGSDYADNIALVATRK